MLVIHRIALRLAGETVGDSAALMMPVVAKPLGVLFIETLEARRDIGERPRTGGDNHLCLRARRWASTASAQVPLSLSLSQSISSSDVG